MTSGEKTIIGLVAFVVLVGMVLVVRVFYPSPRQDAVEEGEAQPDE